MILSDKTMEQATEVILNPGGLTLDMLPNLFSRVASRTIDYADFGQFTMDFADVQMEDDDSEDEQPAPAAAAAINIEQPAAANNAEQLDSASVSASR